MPHLAALTALAPLASAERRGFQSDIASYRQRSARGPPDQSGTHEFGFARRPPQIVHRGPNRSRAPLLRRSADCRDRFDPRRASRDREKPLASFPPSLGGIVERWIGMTKHPNKFDPIED